jgi:ComF family protein
VLLLRIGLAVCDLLWPHRCSACDSLDLPARAPLCLACAASLLPVDPAAACPRCALPLPPGPGGCPDCRQLRPRFRRATAAFQYGGALAAALHRLKWEGRDDLAAPLGRLLVPALCRAAPGCDLIVPVPLHPQRLRARGYNQAGLLAQAARRAAGVALPIRHGALDRTLLAPPGVHKDRRQRLAHAERAFRVPPAAVPLLRGRRVLLVDDVVTTGATASTCARALRRAGAGAVEVLTLCRASP